VSVCIKEHEGFCVCIQEREDFCVSAQEYEDIRGYMQERVDTCVCLYIRTLRFLCLSVCKNVRVLCLVCFIFHNLIRCI